MRRLLSVQIWASLLLMAICSARLEAASISHIQVRVVTGTQELGAGGYLELRIYEVGKAVRRLPLTHGEPWPHDSTHLIPLRLSDALDPRRVLRFALYYRAAGPAPPLEIVAADVELPGQTPPERLLDATLSGAIPKGGELASAEREAGALMCADDADCDDGKACDGQERCAPRAAGADARGCVKGTPVVCPVNQVCTEGRGCQGTESISKIPPQ
jgi:hypothetical protein